MSDPSVSSGPVARGGQLASAQLTIALAAALAAWLFAPEIATLKQHESFVDFFATSAQVIAAVLIALAVEARLVVRSVFLAVVAACSVAIGEVSAIAALSPSLPEDLYRWLFALTVGGGLGGLVTAIVVGAQALADRRDAVRDFELGRLAERRAEDSRD